MKSKRANLIRSYQLATFLLLLLSAQSFAQERSDVRLVQAAEKEAKLVWWTTTNLDLSQRILERFEKKYPSVKTELFRAGRGPLLNKILAEALAGRHAWDVLSGSGEMYSPLMERQLVVPYRSPEILSTKVLSFSFQALTRSTLGRFGSSPSPRAILLMPDIVLEDTR